MKRMFWQLRQGQPVFQLFQLFQRKAGVFLLCMMLLILSGNPACQSSSAQKADTAETVPDIPKLEDYDPVNRHIYQAGETMLRTANNASREGYYKKALKYYNRSVSNFFLIDNHPRVADVYNSMALVQIKRKHYSAASNNLKSAQRINHLYQRPLALGQTLISRGRLQESLKNYPRALRHYANARKILSAVPDRPKVARQSLANAWTGSGYVYYLQKEYHKARKHLLRAIEISYKLRDYSILAEAYSHMGSCFMAEKQYSRALRAFQSALQADKNLENSQGIATDLKNIAEIYEKRQNWEQAAFYYERALRINVALQIPERVMQDLRSLIRVHQKLENREKVTTFREFLQKMEKAFKKRVKKSY